MDYLPGTVRHMRPESGGALATRDAEAERRSTAHNGPVSPFDKYATLAVKDEQDRRDLIRLGAGRAYPGALRPLSFCACCFGPVVALVCRLPGERVLLRRAGGLACARALALRRPRRGGACHKLWQRRVLPSELRLLRILPVRDRGAIRPRRQDDEHAGTRNNHSNHVLHRIVLSSDTPQCVLSAPLRAELFWLVRCSAQFVTRIAQMRN